MTRKILLFLLFGFSIVQYQGTAICAEPNWDRAQKDLIALLQKLIQADTRNPPGKEMAACKVLNSFFDREGIEHRLYRVEKDRANFLARLHGNGAAKPILFAAHTDVVPFEEEDWTYPPLSGQIHEGYIYGRGAIDNKGMLAVEAMALALLKRQNVALRRDLVLVATAGEETGGGPGMGWMIENHREDLEAAFALNEGGRIIARDNRVLYVGIETEEKIAYNIQLSAQGTSGHAAVPRLDNPILALSRALLNIENAPKRKILDPTTRSFFQGLAEVDTTVRWQEGGVETEVPTYLAMLTNTVSPTLVEGGVKTNVLPKSASANLNCRLLPGQNVRDFVDSLKVWVGPGPYQFDYTIRQPAPEPSPRDGLGFILMEQAAQEIFPEAKVLPYLSPGMSDATRLRRAGIPTYGLVPFPLDEGEGWRIHGADERVAIEALMEGLKLVYRLALLAGE